MVAFTENGVLIGHDAQAQAVLNPKNTIFDAKRFIGKRCERCTGVIDSSISCSFDDPTVQRDIGEYLFKVTRVY